jgi:hypothetical protein
MDSKNGGKAGITGGENYAKSGFSGPGRDYQP